jgi:hypothetical protein
MISDDEYLERIVAGIQAVTTRGADVSWNEKINERQFDVVVRFKLGTLRYLVLVEVRNRTRRAEAADMDAFVTKARDQNANKIVFVTAAGFQDGAITVAKRHAVDLFTVTFDDSDPRLPADANFILVRRQGAPLESPKLMWGEVKLAGCVESASIVYDDGTEAEIPDEQSQMAYCVRNAKLADGRTLHDLIQATPFQIELGKETHEEVRLDPPQEIAPPDEFWLRRGRAAVFRFSVIGRNARMYSGNVRVDPNMFELPVVYTNVLTGESNRFSIDALPLGVERVSPGQFYFNYHPLTYYYCDSIQRSEVLWYMVESFQNAELLQIICTQDVRYSPSYIPVTDRKILRRLRARLERMKEHERRHG